MKYLITGGLGVIGSLCARRLEGLGHKVTLIDDGNDPRHALNESALNPDKTLCYGQRLEDFAPDVLSDIVGDSDRILHAAASTGIPYSAAAPRDDWRRNVDGTIALLEALRHNPRPTVVLSSVKPYGLGRLASMERATRYELSGLGVSEDFPLEPEEPYGASKAAQSLVCHAYAKSYGLPLVVFRCSNLYGPAACHGPRHGWLTWFCIQAALGLPIEVQGKGNQTRDMLFWSDVLSATESAWSKLDTGPIATFTENPIRGSVWNLGGGRNNTTSPLEAVATLRSLGADIATTNAPGRRHEDALFVTDASAAERALKWLPRVNVEDGIAQVYEWAQKNARSLEKVYADGR
jgi:nucleoside-diphosphate-sugar epimerase